MFTAGSTASVNVELQPGTNAVLTATLTNPAGTGSFHYPNGGGPAVLAFPTILSGTITGPDNADLIGSSPDSNGAVTIQCNGAVKTPALITDPAILVSLVNRPDDIRDVIQWVDDLAGGRNADVEAAKRNCEKFGAAAARANMYLSDLKARLEKLRNEYQANESQFYDEDYKNPNLEQQLKAEFRARNPWFKNAEGQMQRLSADIASVQSAATSLGFQYAACQSSLSHVGGGGLTQFAPMAPSIIDRLSSSSYSPVALSRQSALDAIEAAAPTQQLVRRGNVALWMRGNANGWGNNASGASARGGAGSVQAGAQVLLHEGTTLGAFANVRHSTARIASLNQKISLDALGGGAYVSRALASRFRATALVFYEAGANDYTTALARAAFDSTRLGIGGRFSGTWRYANWTLTPSLAAVYQTVRRDAFTDSSATFMPSQTSRTGDLTGGVTMAYAGLRPAFPLAATITPYLTLASVWQFTGPSSFNPAAGVIVNANSALSATIAGGLNMAFHNGAGLDLALNLGGLGGVVQTWSLSCGGSLPLSAIGLGERNHGRLGFAVSQSEGGQFGSRMNVRVPLQ